MVSAKSDSKDEKEFTCAAVNVLGWVADLCHRSSGGIWRAIRCRGMERRFEEGRPSLRPGLVHTEVARKNSLVGAKNVHGIGAEIL